MKRSEHATPNRYKNIIHRPNGWHDYLEGEDITPLQVDLEECETGADPDVGETRQDSSVYQTGSTEFQPSDERN